MSTTGGAALEPLDCGFSDAGRWFRLRACGIVVDERGWVLMARNSRDPYFYSVGGGVHHGETVADAARRELLEETGVACDVGPLAVVHQNFFRDEMLGARDCHELAFYFLATPRQPVPTGPGNATSSTVDGVVEHLEWVDPVTIGREVVAYPTFLGTELPGILAGDDLPRSIVTRE